MKLECRYSSLLPLPNHSKQLYFYHLWQLYCVSIVVQNFPPCRNKLCSSLFHHHSEGSRRSSECPWNVLCYKHRDLLEDLLEEIRKDTVSLRQLNIILGTGFFSLDPTRELVLFPKAFVILLVFYSVLKEESL